MHTIIQLTDLHFASNGEKNFDIDTTQNLYTIIDVLKNEIFDEIVITGDLAFREGQPEIYQQLQEILSQFNKPITAIPGNHDNGALQSKYFPIKTIDAIGEEFYFSRKIKNYTAIFLDTSKEYISEAQLAWIKKELDTVESKCIIFMHHPPLKCGIKYMDKKYPLQNIDNLQTIFSYCKTELYIFCGHYHAPCTVHFKNQHIHISPSAFYMLNQESETFSIESLLIGFRKIQISNEHITTRVRLFECNKA